jgi:hypothetical protein
MSRETRDSKKLFDEREARVSTANEGAPGTPPEYKAMETKGISGAGRLTLDQYHKLVSRGHDGDVVRRWTEYHAAHVLKETPGSSAQTAAPQTTSKQPALVVLREDSKVLPPGTRPGEDWDHRLWQSVSAISPMASTGGPPLRKPRASKLPPGLGVQFCRDRKWRRTQGRQQQEITVQEAAAALGVSASMLVEWTEKVCGLDANAATPISVSAQERNKRTRSQSKRRRPQTWLDKVTTQYPKGAGAEELERKGPGWWHGGE